MRRQVWFLAALLMIIGLGASAQKKKTAAAGGKQFQVYAVGFYNQENLFDTCHDAGKNDYEYLPAKGWNGMKYTSKLKNMSRALADMGTDVLPNVGCAFIGLAEVENANVLKDLTAQPPLKARNMQFCHIEGPDKRGIDCALLYNPALFRVKNVKLVPYVQELAKDSAFKTRGFLTVRGEMAGEDVAVIVCHWPSRFSVSFYRESGARQTKVVKDSLLRVNPDMKVFVMGDMNDDPTDKSMHEVLRAMPEISQVGEGEHFGFVHVTDFCLRKVKVFNDSFTPAQINFLKVVVHEYVKEEEGGAVAEIQHFGKLVILKIQFRNVCAVEKINGT